MTKIKNEETISAKKKAMAVEYLFNLYTTEMNTEEFDEEFNSATIGTVILETRSGKRIEMNLEYAELRELYDIDGEDYEGE